MRTIIAPASQTRKELLDITTRVRRIVEGSGARDGLCCVYAHGATAAIMIQEHGDAFPAPRYPLAAGAPGDCRHLPALRIGALSASPAAYGMQGMRT